MQPMAIIASRPDVHRVAAQREGDHRVVGEAELARAVEDHVVVQPLLGEQPVHPGEADLEGQRHRVGEQQRRSAGAALPAVDRHEVDPRPVGRHEPGELLPELEVADRGLDAHRQPRPVGEQLDPVEHAVDVAELGVPRGADAVDALGDAAGLGDLGRDLLAGQVPAEARLRALAELDLDRAHGPAGHDVLEPGEVEAAGGVAAAEVGRADLQHELAAVAVVAGQPALAGVVQAARHRRAAVEGLDGRGRQRAEAHRRDVHDRRRPERPGPPAGRTEHLRARAAGPRRRGAGPTAGRCGRTSGA
jgi:hypothetical protein